MWLSVAIIADDEHEHEHELSITVRVDSGLYVPVLCRCRRLKGGI